MKGMNAFADSASVKTARVLAEIMWLIGWLGLVFCFVLIYLLLFTGYRPGYFEVPVRVMYNELTSRAILGQNSSVPILRAVGFGNVYVAGELLGMQKILLVIPVVLVAGYLWFTSLLRSIILSIREGHPFTRDNVVRLRRLGILMLAGYAVYYFSMLLFGRLMIPRIMIPGATLVASVDGDISVIFLGIVLLVISGVFDYGVGLRKKTADCGLGDNRE